MLFPENKPPFGLQHGSGGQGGGHFGSHVLQQSIIFYLQITRNYWQQGVLSSPQFMNNKRMSIKNHNAVLLFSQQPLPKPNICAHLLIFGFFAFFAFWIRNQSQQPKRSRNTKMKNNIPSFPLKRFWQQPLVIVNTSKLINCIICWA